VYNLSKYSKQFTGKNVLSVLLSSGEVAVILVMTAIVVFFIARRRKK
jgi:hypothetical protein